LRRGKGLSIVVRREARREIGILQKREKEHIRRSLSTRTSRRGKKTRPNSSWKWDSNLSGPAVMFQ